MMSIEVLSTAWNVSSLVGSLIVGGVFLVTGLAKIIDPKTFTNHISQLGVLPSRAILPVAFVFIALEYLLGNALIFRLFPEWLFPAMLVILLGLSILTYWSTSTGKTQDCGCYTGLLEISPKQSLVLNSIYIALISLALFHPVTNFLSTFQQFWLLLVIVSSSVLSITLSYRRFRTTGTPLWDLTPLKVNRRWQSQWLSNDNSNLMQGTKLVAFLNPGCHYCQIWVKALKIMHQHPAFPEVIGIMSAAQETVQEYIEEKHINFPVYLIENSVFSRLISGTPTAVILEDGVIKNKWVATLPREVVEKLRFYREQDKKEAVTS